MGASDSNAKIEGKLLLLKGNDSPQKSKSTNKIKRIEYSDEDSNQDKGPNLGPFQERFENKWRVRDFRDEQAIKPKIIKKRTVVQKPNTRVANPLKDFDNTLDRLLLESEDTSAFQRQQSEEIFLPRNTDKKKLFILDSDPEWAKAYKQKHGNFQNDHKQAFQNQKLQNYSRYSPNLKMTAQIPQKISQENYASTSQTDYSSLNSNKPRMGDFKRQSLQNGALGVLQNQNSQFKPKNSSLIQGQPHRESYQKSIDLNQFDSNLNDRDLKRIQTVNQTPKANYGQQQIQKMSQNQQQRWGGEGFHTSK